MKSFFSLEKNEIESVFKDIGIPKFRASQLWDWIYEKGVFKKELMTNLPSSLFDKIKDSITLFDLPIPTNTQKSKDGTVKWLLQFNDFKEAETVFIPDLNRKTVCVSSQIGCMLNCSFCHTGTQDWVRNLTAAEIIMQVLFARQECGPITNIVFMGMGEPLLNFENVLKSVKIISTFMSPKRITISTSGVVPMIERCVYETNAKLAISLHSVRDETRDILVPLNKKYNIKDIIDVCRKISRTSKVHEFKKITFEYVMLKDINDSDDEAKEFVNIVQGIPCKINLIPFNKWPDAEYEPSSMDRIIKFASIISKAGIEAPIRKQRGDDILAACGQLKSKSQRTLLRDAVRQNLTN